MLSHSRLLFFICLLPMLALLASGMNLAAEETTFGERVPQCERLDVILWTLRERTVLVVDASLKGNGRFEWKYALPTDDVSSVEIAALKASPEVRQFIYPWLSQPFRVWFWFFLLCVYWSYYKINSLLRTERGYPALGEMLGWFIVVAGGVGFLLFLLFYNERAPIINPRDFFSHITIGYGSNRKSLGDAAFVTDVNGKVAKVYYVGESGAERAFAMRFVATYSGGEAQLDFPALQQLRPKKTTLFIAGDRFPPAPMDRAGKFMRSLSPVGVILNVQLPYQGDDDLWRRFFYNETLFNCTVISLPKENLLQDIASFESRPAVEVWKWRPFSLLGVPSRYICMALWPLVCLLIALITPRKELKFLDAMKFAILSSLTGLGLLWAVQYFAKKAPDATGALDRLAKRISFVGFCWFLVIPFLIPLP